MNTELKNFIQTVLVPEGYSMSFAEPSIDQLETLIEIATTAKEELEDIEYEVESAKDKEQMEFLLFELDTLINSDKEWEDKYDLCWCIKDKMFRISAFSWDDPDCDYSDDVYAFYSAAKRHIGEM